MNPAEFLLDLANGNINDVSLPSELEDRVHMENAEAETPNGKPSPAVVHEVTVTALCSISFVKNRHSKIRNWSW